MPPGTLTGGGSWRCRPGPPSCRWVPVQRGGDVGAGVGGGGLWRQRGLAGTPRRLQQLRPEQTCRQPVHARGVAVHLVDGGAQRGRQRWRPAAAPAGPWGVGRTAAGRKEFILVLGSSGGGGECAAGRGGAVVAPELGAVLPPQALLLDCMGQPIDSAPQASPAGLEPGGVTRGRGLDHLLR
jgi:hypothetical protein